MRLLFIVVFIYLFSSDIIGQNAEGGRIIFQKQQLISNTLATQHPIAAGVAVKICCDNRGNTYLGGLCNTLDSVWICCFDSSLTLLFDKKYAISDFDQLKLSNKHQLLGLHVLDDDIYFHYSLNIFIRIDNFRYDNHAISFVKLKSADIQQSIKQIYPLSKSELLLVSEKLDSSCLSPCFKKRLFISKYYWNQKIEFIGEFEVPDYFFLQKKGINNQINFNRSLSELIYMNPLNGSIQKFKILGKGISSSNITKSIEWDSLSLKYQAIVNRNYLNGEVNAASVFREIDTLLNDIGWYSTVGWIDSSKYFKIMIHKSKKSFVEECDNNSNRTIQKYFFNTIESLENNERITNHSCPVELPLFPIVFSSNSLFIPGYDLELVKIGEISGLEYLSFKRSSISIENSLFFPSIKKYVLVSSKP
jgi:hypothetical protein